VQKRGGREARRDFHAEDGGSLQQQTEGAVMLNAAKALKQLLGRRINFEFTWLKIVVQVYLEKKGIK
jgi:hypothetical protein